MKKVLIIDDRQENADLIINWIKKNSDAEIMTAEDVSEAISLLKFHKFDFVVCDYFLTDGNGDNILEYLKLNQIEVPLVIFTSKHYLSPRVDYPLVGIVFKKDYQQLFRTIKRNSSIIRMDQ